MVPRPARSRPSSCLPDRDDVAEAAAAPVTTAPSKKAPAKEVPAKKVPAKKAAAAKAPTKKAPTKKAPSKQAAVLAPALSLSEHEVAEVVGTDVDRA